MKFVLAALVFILALSVTPKVVAAEPEVCTANQKENCTEPKTSSEKSSHVEAKAAHGESHKAAEEKEEKLGKEMNSLFPTKQKNPVQADRPTVVKLTAPKFLAKVSGASTKLEWSAVEGASSYHVQVATDPNFKWLVANDAFVKTNSFEATQLEAGKHYYWRVASVKSQNDSMFTKSLFVSSVFTTNP
jgi:hypothetical protein